jgi:hypothetical protein
MIKAFNIFLKFNTPAILWSGFILLLCGIPGSDFPDMSLWALLSPDKFIHFGLFLILMVLCLQGLKKQHVFKYSRYNALKISLIWCLVLAIGSEILQDYFFIERSADVFDVIANVAGSFSGVLVFWLIYGRKNTFGYS